MVPEDDRHREALESMKSLPHRAFALGLLAVSLAPTVAVAATPASAQLADNAKKDAYYTYALKHFGKPTGCQVTGVQTFDNQTFGTVTCRFRNGVELKEETMPPEVFRVTLRCDRGFADAAGLRTFAETDARARGFNLDFGHPNKSQSPGGVAIQAYWDPDTSVNAAIELGYKSNELVSVSIHAAP